MYPLSQLLLLLLLLLLYGCNYKNLWLGQLGKNIVNSALLLVIIFSRKQKLILVSDGFMIMTEGTVSAILRLTFTIKRLQPLFV